MFYRIPVVIMKEIEKKMEDRKAAIAAANRAEYDQQSNGWSKFSNSTIILVHD